MKNVKKYMSTEASYACCDTVTYICGVEASHDNVRRRRYHDVTRVGQSVLGRDMTAVVQRPHTR